MESFIEKQAKLLEVQPADAPGRDSEETAEGCVDGRVSDAAAPAQGLSSSDPGTETELADTALDLLVLLLMEQWRWLCTESMQKVLHLVFGTLIQRWLEVQVAHLTCPQRWVQYLRLLQESIWPGGALPKCPRPVRTPEQKAAAEKQALQSLMGVLPDAIVEILGEDKCRLSWSLVLESLQQPLINRHLIYCLWDIILELLELSASAEESAVTSSTTDTPGRRASPLSQRPLSRFFEGNTIHPGVLLKARALVSRTSPQPMEGATSQGPPRSPVLPSTPACRGRDFGRCPRKLLP